MLTERIFVPTLSQSIGHEAKLIRDQCSLTGVLNYVYLHSIIVKHFIDNVSILARDQTYNVQVKSVCLDKGLVCSVNVRLLTVMILAFYISF